MLLEAPLTHLSNLSYKNLFPIEIETTINSKSEVIYGGRKFYQVFYICFFSYGFDFTDKRSGSRFWSLVRVMSYAISRLHMLRAPAGGSCLVERTMNSYNDYLWNVEQIYSFMPTRTCVPVCAIKMLRNVFFGNFIKICSTLILFSCGHTAAMFSADVRTAVANERHTFRDQNSSIQWDVDQMWSCATTRWPKIHYKKGFDGFSRQTPARNVRWPFQTIIPLEHLTICKLSNKWNQPIAKVTICIW